MMAIRWRGVIVDPISLPSWLYRAQQVVTIDDEELRPLTEEEDEAARELGMYNRRWYGAWVDSGFTPEEIVEWYPLTTYRTVIPVAAVRLIASGWTPTDFREAIIRSSEVYQPSKDGDQALRDAVLWDEVAAYHHGQMTAAIVQRDDALCTARKRGMATKTLARHFDRYKQQVNYRRIGVWHRRSF